MAIAISPLMSASYGLDQASTGLRHYLRALWQREEDAGA